MGAGAALAPTGAAADGGLSGWSGRAGALLVAGNGAVSGVRVGGGGAAGLVSAGVASAPATESAASACSIRLAVLGATMTSTEAGSVALGGVVASAIAGSGAGVNASAASAAS